MPANDPRPDYCGLILITGDPAKKVKAQFNLFHELDEERYLAFQEAAQRLQRVIDGGLIVYARQALADIQGLADQVRKIIPTVPAPRVYRLAGDWRVNVACAVLTFCSALHLYQEQSEGEVARHYGDPSPELAEVQRKFSDAYDRSLAYRLVYRLRNVLVHHSLKSVELFLSGEEDRTPAGLILHRHTVRLPLIREVFLSAKRGVSASIRKELEEMADDPDLLDLCREAMAALEQVHKNIFDLVHPYLVQDAQLISELDSLFGDGVGDRALGKMLNLSNSSPTKLPHMLLRRDLFEYAKEVASRQ